MLNSLISSDLYEFFLYLNLAFLSSQGRSNIGGQSVENAKVYIAPKEEKRKRTLER